MSKDAENEHGISLSDLPQEVLEMGTIAHLLAHGESIFLYSLLNISPSCYQDPVAARVYAGVVQGIISSRNHGASIPVENLNFADTDALAIDYIRRAVAGGYPCLYSLAPCLIELHDRHVLAMLENETDFDAELERISQEYADDPDEMPW
jgi:hypothetical protein